MQIILVMKTENGIDYYYRKMGGWTVDVRDAKIFTSTFDAINEIPVPIVFGRQDKYPWYLFFNTSK